ncbi:histidine phosphatase family protein [Candidatus Tokpelaia sp.]|uniref:histidine phosphatase family protein n=1 Tax=Candidatus Tokpelaia sp. TaxID=2233777 RepID=UPI001FEEF550|nr:histidine phosphatase family protein [Candidatus Tokpelaia sp.]
MSQALFAPVAESAMRHLPLIYFSRHGQTDWNAVGRIQGSIDTDIDTTGRAQAAANGLKLKALIGRAEDFYFVASPMRRTRETMERLRASMRLAPQAYATDNLLREICFGDWQGFQMAEIAERYPSAYAARLADKWHFLPIGEGAETYEMLAERANSWLATLGHKTVCVTHGGWLRTILHRFGGLDKNAAANSIIPQDKILKLENGRLEWL